MKRLASLLVRPLFAVTRWLAWRLGLCDDCGKDELCWGGRCLDCCQRRGDDKFKRIEELLASNLEVATRGPTGEPTP